MKLFKKIIITAIAVILFSGLESCSSTYPVTSTTEYTNPAWAPQYSTGVRYYYLPDIETYYDLQNNDFVYMDDGQWQFSASLPSMYDGYDLYNGFEVSLNNSVYQPWLHNQYYASHYPRYYYRNKYQGSATGVRGFNENVRQPIYRKTENNNSVNAIPNSKLNPRQVMVRPQSTRPAQNPIYNNKNIGQPVKVHSNMRKNTGGSEGNKKGGKH